MEQQKNLERSDSELSDLSSSVQELSLYVNPNPENGEEEDGDEELPDNLLQSFCTETDEDFLQKEYDMISSGSLNELGEINEGNSGTDEGDIVNGIYFDKLELELNAIEQAMSQFEGRLDSLREQAQDLLQTLQNERLNPDGKPVEAPANETTAAIEEKGSGDD